MKTLGITYIWHGMPDWDDVRAEIAIINPQSGPGDVKSIEWDRLIRSLRERNIRPVPYVALTYGKKSIASVKTELAKYRQWYGLNDAFYDEAPVRPLKYLMDLNGYARKDPLTSKKTGFVVFNPGSRPKGLITAMAYTANAVWVTFEGSEEEYLSRRQQVGPFRSREAHIVYAATTYPITKVQMENYGIGWGFVTNDTLPNPFDTWPRVWYSLG